MLKSCLWVMAGGAIGAAARYLTCLAVVRRWGAEFPYGTLLVNLAGCFLIGFFMTWSLEYHDVPQKWRQVFAVGFLGALTTFSTFSYESLQLAIAGELGPAAVNIAVQVLGGFFLAWFGMACARIMGSIFFM